MKQFYLASAILLMFCLGIFLRREWRDSPHPSKVSGDPDQSEHKGDAGSEQNGDRSPVAKGQKREGQALLAARPQFLESSAQNKKVFDTLRLRFAAGDYQTCLRLIDEHLDSDSSDQVLKSWLKAQLQVVLIQTAWMHLKTGHCDRALEDFSRARSFGRHKDIATGSAVCLQRFQRSDEASLELEWYLKQQPSDSSAFLLYAEILESRRLFEQARTALQQALTLSDDQKEREVLTGKLRSMEGKADESRDQEQSLSRYFSLLYPAIYLCFFVTRL